MKHKIFISTNFLLCLFLGISSADGVMTEQGIESETESETPREKVYEKLRLVDMPEESIDYVIKEFKDLEDVEMVASDLQDILEDLDETVMFTRKAKNNIRDKKGTLDDEVEISLCEKARADYNRTAEIVNGVRQFEEVEDKFYMVSHNIEEVMSRPDMIESLVKSVEHIQDQIKTPLVYNSTAVLKRIKRNINTTWSEGTEEELKQTSQAIKRAKTEEERACLLDSILDAGRKEEDMAKYFAMIATQAAVEKNIQLITAHEISRVSHLPSEIANIVASYDSYLPGYLL